MIAFLRRTSVMALLMTALLSGVALAAEGGPTLVIVADTRGLSGPLAWLANLYNESHLYFTVFTAIAVPAMGLILGLLADVVMRKIGLDLKSRKLAER
ncbi:MAG TPA: DVU0150 family protein [Syntrophorhabdales bacterium]|nr:DVU0150 family protein [Syntrophorhabdales bacterium]